MLCSVVWRDFPAIFSCFPLNSTPKSDQIPTFRGSTFKRFTFKRFQACSALRQFVWYIIFSVFIDCILFHVQSSGVELDRSTDDTAVNHFTNVSWCHRSAT